MILWWFNNSHLPCFSLTTNQTKQFNPFLSLLKQMCVSSSLMHYITICVFASMTLPYFIIVALEHCKVRIKMSRKHSKESRIYFLITSHHHQQPHDYITKQLWSLLPFILNKYHWFAHWLSKDHWMLHKLSCHSCCSCWFTHSKCEKQWI